MSRAKNIENTENALQPSTVKIHFQCPVCSQLAHLDIDKEIFEQSDSLTTISVPKGIICEHAFHAFVDKNYQIRGYQRVDFEFKQKKSLAKKEYEKNPITELAEEEERKLKKDIDFKNLILKMNEVIFNPESDDKELKKIKQTLKTIYEDFWDFIPNDNGVFEKFIENDKRRIHFVL